MSLVGTATAQGLDLRKVDWRYWSTLTEGEQMSYVNGVIGGTYALAFIYMADNEGLGGPSLFDYAPMQVYNTILWDLVNRVYAIREFREVPIPAILLNYKQWMKYLRR